MEHPVLVSIATLPVRQNNVRFMNPGRYYIGDQINGYTEKREPSSFVEDGGLELLV
jgi:hypothetical protein